jgi:putative tryptophan/tyrosine transport system substrate-binding protein
VKINLIRRRDLLRLAGVMAARPGIVFAQQKAIPVIGYLSNISIDSAGLTQPLLTAFRKGLKELGYVEGQNVTIEYRWAEGRYDRLPALAAELVERKVDVIAVTGGGDLASRTAKNATSTIPIVFVGGGDPVAAGVVESLARPGGNLTGVSFLAVELTPKRLDLLSELVPRARLIALLVNPNSPTTERMVRDVQDAARLKGVQLTIVRAAAVREFEPAFASLAQLHADGLVVAADPFFGSSREQLIALAARYGIPAIYAFRENPDSGGLISYGPSLTGTYRQAGVYVGRILAGTKPAELPMQQPTNFELIVNLKTAKALGLTIPQSILIRADEVID